MSESLSALLYLVASICFIMALRGLSSPDTARGGNIYGIAGLAIAILTTLASPGIVSYWLIAVGIVIGGAVGAYIARQIQMTALPQLVAAFHSLVGLAAVCVATAAFAAPEAYGIGMRGAIHPSSLIEMAIGLTIGAITFTASVVAFAKLQGIVSGRPLVFPGQHLINLALGVLLIALIVLFVMTEASSVFALLVLLSLAFGFLLIVPIGGADMPVVISMLNSYSGWAAAGIGFTLSNSLLIITGALVGSSGAILSYIMCKGMNRSIINVILGGFGTEGGAAPARAGAGDRLVKSGSAEDAAFILKNAGSVIIVPGYGMAVAQAQHALREMADILKKDGVKVSYAIHPLAQQLAIAAYRLGPLAGAPLRGLLVIAPKLHFPENPFALHFLLQGSESLVDVVVAYEDLHGHSLRVWTQRGAAGGTPPENLTPRWAGVKQGRQNAWDCTALRRALGITYLTHGSAEDRPHGAPRLTRPRRRDR